MNNTRNKHVVFSAKGARYHWEIADSCPYRRFRVCVFDEDVSRFISHTWNSPEHRHEGGTHGTGPRGLSELMFFFTV